MTQSHSNSTHRPPPVIVLGAARSGTKLVRSIIAASSTYSAVPHDVNYVWRLVDPNRSNDLLDAKSLTPRSQETIRRMLFRIAGLRKSSAGSIVEKTVSNTLRVPFVDKVFPDARYVHLIRDGRDVAESAMRCWQAPPEFSRLLGKLVTFPWWSCRGYAARYAGDWATRFVTRKNQLQSWGPRYAGIEEDVRSRSLAEVCGRQWRVCVEHTQNSLRAIDSDRWIELRYEDLLENPRAAAAHVGSFLGLQDINSLIALAQQRVVRPTGPRRIIAQSVDLDSLNRCIEPLRKRLGYGVGKAA